MTTKYEHAKFLIERFDNFYDTINNKGSFYIGLNTFILGGLCAGYITIQDKIAHGVWFWILLTGAFSLCILGIAYTIRALSPFLKDNKNNDDIASLIFFGGIAKHNLNTFLTKIMNLDDAAIEEDIYRQVHCLAGGLDAKFKKIKIVSYLLLGLLVTITLLFIYILNNYKP